MATTSQGVASTEPEAAGLRRIDSERLEAADAGDRPRAVRPDRPRAAALAARLVGRPVHELDAGRPRGPGPALPVHRRPAGPADARLGAAAPGRVPRRGRRPRPLAGSDCRSTWRRRAPTANVLLALVGADGGRGHGAQVHRRRHARRGAPDRPEACGAGGWPSPPTCSARRSSARPRPTPTSRPASTCSAASPARWPPSPRSR